MCLARRYFATGSFQNLVGDSVHVHKSTVCRAVRAVAVSSVQASEHICSLPCTAWGTKPCPSTILPDRWFPKCDRLCWRNAHPYQDPNGPQTCFCQQKRIPFHKCTDVKCTDLKITNCVIKWPGSKHDSYVLRHSQFGEDFEALRLWYASGVAAPLRPVGATHPWGGSNYHENLGEWQLAGLWWPVKDIGYIYSIYIQYIQYIFWLYWIHMYGRGLGPHM